MKEKEVKVGIVNISNSDGYYFVAFVKNVKKADSTFDVLYSGKVNIIIKSSEEDSKKFLNKVIHFKKNNFLEVTEDTHPEYFV